MIGTIALGVFLGGAGLFALIAFVAYIVEDYR